MLDEGSLDLRVDAAVEFAEVVTDPAPAPVATAPPTVAGTPRVGASLTATSGSWDQPDLTFGYQWVRDREAIAGATAPTHVVQPVDAGRRLAVTVMATRSGHVDGRPSHRPVRAAARSWSRIAAGSSAR